MARYQIVDQHPGLDIALTEVAGRETALLEAFSECQQLWTARSLGLGQPDDLTPE